MYSSRTRRTTRGYVPKPSATVCTRRPRPRSSRICSRNHLRAVISPCLRALNCFLSAGFSLRTRSGCRIPTFDQINRPRARPFRSKTLRLGTSWREAAAEPPSGCLTTTTTGRCENADAYADKAGRPLARSRSHWHRPTCCGRRRPPAPLQPSPIPRRLRLEFYVALLVLLPATARA
jgi:hypothetical protein